MRRALAVAGSLNMDFVVSTARLPAPGETVTGHNFHTAPGGKGANQACAAARLSAGRLAVRMIGRCGYDAFGDQLKAGLAAAGADVSGVHAVRAAATGVAMIEVDAEGRNSIVIAPGANAMLSEADMEQSRPVFRGCSFVLFQLESPMETVAAGLEIARDEGAETMLDPAPARVLGGELLRMVDVLTPNESEARILLGSEPGEIEPKEAPEVARALHALGPRAVVLKLGHQGAFFFDGTVELFQPGYLVDSVDSTAAGDTFNAGFAVARAEGKGVAEALRFACGAAAISVTRSGAQPSIPSRAEVENFLSTRA
jgi:ribokinase